MDTSTRSGARAPRGAFRARSRWYRHLSAQRRKNQDSTELTGDINYRKIAEYGSESDPRAFNFDGEFNIANRGLVEFVEVLKLDVAFLYDLLGASQEHKIKPKRFRKPTSTK
jgi:predicted Ser/Thr protein kinase